MGIRIAKKCPNGFIKKYDPELTKKINKLLPQIANKYQIHPGIFLRLIIAESGGNYLAESHKGAIGLGQVMPRNAPNVDLRDPIQNLEAAAQHLQNSAYKDAKRAQQDFFSNIPQTTHMNLHILALYAYNAGAPTLRNAIREAQKNNNIQNFQTYLPKETQDYPYKILEMKNVQLNIWTKECK